jgi:cyclophilin family peptidyl-prolyl cis-trans isomerase/HEAT repeat protein
MVCAVSLIVAGCGADRLTKAEALLDVLALEDARPLGAQGVQALVGRTTSEDSDTRRFAVRALGRLEDPTLLDRLTPLLSDEDPSVRASAAWAVAQAVHGADGAEAIAPLLRAAGAETVPVARGELARSLGRVRPEEGDSRAVVGLLAEWAADPELPVEVALGVALGLEGLTRFPGPAASDDGLYGALESLATRPARAAGAEGRVRAVALLALGQRGRLTDTQVGSALQDPDPDVRSVGARFLATVDGPERESLVAIALADEAPQVRVEAMRVTSTGERSAGRCQWLLAAAVSQDPSAARLVAIDALSSPCPEPMGSAVLDVLDSLAAEPPEEGDGWHPATHALNALARTAPQRATIHLDIHVRHESPFVRAQAAGTAAVLGDATALRALADDPDPNVRTAAFPALVELEGLPATTPLLVDALGSDDGQLLLTVAGLLTGTDHADAGTAAIEAFERISRARRQTARDPRMALLELLSESGGLELAPRLQPYLEDYDPLVATRVAALLTTWTGEPAEARPQPPERLPLPSAQDVADMAASRVALHMASGGTITVELLPYLAPTNAYRFFRLASEGHFDGLTFHRVVPAFVIQGGSPAANEYAGDGPFTRDEIGRISHWRGTVGLSTRGRDTGDGQIFVNLVHNIRLDHDYTIFGRVVSGMEYVDRVRAGDVIQSVEILR